MPNKCQDDKILNPATGRCVLKTGKVGQALLQQQCPSDKIVNPATGKCVLKTGKIGMALLKQQANEPTGKRVSKFKKSTSKINTVDPNICKSVGMKQLRGQGTCWFNTTINMLTMGHVNTGLVQWIYNNKLSDQERIKVDNYTFVNADACPMPNKIIAMRLLINELLKKRKPLDPLDPLEHAVHIGMRDTPDWHKDRNKHGYHVVRALPRFLSYILDPQEYMIEKENVKQGPSPRTLIYCIMAPASMNRNATTLADFGVTSEIAKNFVLSTAHIRYRRGTDAIYHAMTGFMCNGKPFLYDSNFKKPLELDWRESLEGHPHSDSIPFVSQIGTLMFVNQAKIRGGGSLGPR